MNQNELEHAGRIVDVLEMTAKTLIDVLAEFKEALAKKAIPSMTVAGYPLIISETGDEVHVGELSFPRETAITVITRFCDFAENYGGINGVSVAGGTVVSISELRDIVDFIE